jgi:hypothetical protein
MQTSCGLFFDDLAGVERLAPARNNRGESGVVVFRRAREVA